MVSAVLNTEGSTFSVGDWVVFRKTKFSRQPGRRAASVSPAENGDGYSYLVDKYWVVDEVLGDGRVRVRTRRGKQHTLATSDLRLRPANMWERFVHRRRFLVTADQSEVETSADDASIEKSGLTIA